MVKKITLLVSLFALVSCGTLHNYGTSHFEEINSNKFRISFQGKNNSKENMAYDLALLKSAEVTLKNGFRYFAIIDSEFDSKVTSNPYISGYSRQTKHGVRKVTYGRYSYPVPYTYTTYVPKYENSISKSPRVTHTIICYKEKPEFKNFHNAIAIKKEIKYRYGIN